MANIAFPGLGRLASLGSRLAAMQRMQQGKQGFTGNTNYLNPQPTPPGPMQGIANRPQEPLGAPKQNSDISLPPMTAGVAPEPAQAPTMTGPVLPSPPASSMIRDVTPHSRPRERFAF